MGIVKTVLMAINLKKRFVSASESCVCACGCACVGLVRASVRSSILVNINAHALTPLKHQSIHPCIHKNTSDLVHIQIYVCVYVYILYVLYFVYHIYIYVCMCVYIYIHVYTRTHTHTHTHMIL
jgi:hypothetical protein